MAAKTSNQTMHLDLSFCRRIQGISHTKLFHTQEWTGPLKIWQEPLLAEKAHKSLISSSQYSKEIELARAKKNLKSDSARMFLAF